MQAQDRQALEAKLAAYAADPFGSHGWAKRLTNSPEFRIRQGNWRALGVVDQAKRTVFVVRVVRRDKAY